MFQSHALLCPAGRASLFHAEPGLIGRRLVAAAAVASLLVAIVTLPRPSLAPQHADGIRVLTVQAETPAALRDRAEALRAEMLAVPGVRAVRIEGLQQQSLSVAYRPNRLAALGITQADLAGSLGTEVSGAAPDRIDVRSDDVSAIANTPVHAGGRVFRLGDVAMVQRVPMPQPVSTMRVDGQPAARLIVSGAHPGE